MISGESIKDTILKNAKKRKIEDRIDIDGRTFQLKSFDPLIGNYILVTLLSVVLPFGIGDAIKSSIGYGSENIPTKISDSSNMIDKKSFIELQKDILSYVEEVLPAGNTPIILSNGNYGIMNFNMGIAIKLLIAEITFNFSDFFGEFLSSDKSIGD